MSLDVYIWRDGGVEMLLFFFYARFLVGIPAFCCGEGFTLDMTWEFISRDGEVETLCRFLF